MILPQNELHYFEEVSKADPTSVVGFRAAHAELDPNDTSVVKHSNIFMDFCCHGDLHDLISLYVKEWQDEFSKDPQFTDIETPP